MASIDERIRAFKRGLTLQLFLRRGPFYEDVFRIRSVYRINPEVAVPDKLDRDELSPPPDQPHLRYADAVRRLHDRFVPEDLYMGDRQASYRWWNPFLRSCVLYSPPSDDLLSYADANAPEMPEPVRSPPAIGETFRPPQNVVVYKDENNVRMGADLYWLSIIERACARRALDAADFKRTIFEVMEEDAEELRLVRWRGEHPDIRSEPVFASLVHRSTTKAEYDEAWPNIRAMQRKTVTAGRRGADDLTCVQCATWHDQDNLSPTAIARRLRTRVYRDRRKKETETAKSITMYIEKGRQILQQMAE